MAANLTLNLIILTIFRKKVKIMKIKVKFSVQLCSLFLLDPHRPSLPNTVSLSIPCILFNTLETKFSTTETTGKIMVLYTLIFIGDIKNGKTKYSEMHTSSYFPNLNYSQFFSWMQFWLATVVSKYMKLASFSKDLLYYDFFL
jgi:hypothetical protein